MARILPLIYVWTLAESQANRFSQIWCNDLCTRCEHSNIRCL